MRLRTVLLIILSVGYFSCSANKQEFQENKVEKNESEYNACYSENEIIMEYFYPDSDIVLSRIYSKDTIIITGDNPIECNKYYVSYYENGQIKEAGYQGFFQGQGIPVGIYKEYDENGFLVKTKNYIYPKQKEDIMAMDAFTYIIESEYYENGHVQWEKWYKNYVYYETDEENKVPIGTWKYYDRNGKLIKTEKHTELENQETLEKDR